MFWTILVDSMHVNPGIKYKKTAAAEASCSGMYKPLEAILHSVIV